MGRLLGIGVAAVVLLAPLAQASGVRVASLRVLNGHPLTVRGSHFTARERVRVVAHAQGSGTRTARATQSGTFTVTFETVELSTDRCSGGLIVTARGNLGSTAVLKWPQPDCPPSLGP